MKEKTKKIKFPLYLQIIFGMLAGIAAGLVGLYFHGNNLISNWIQPFGQLFIRLLQLVAVPLVFVSLIKGIIGLKDIATLSKLGIKTIGIYILTTIIAITLGVSLAQTIKPGKFFDTNLSDNIESQFRETIDKTIQISDKEAKPLDFLFDIVPDNIVSALSDNKKMLQIIFFALLFGIAALSVGKAKSEAVLKLIDSLYEIILRIVDFVIRLAPFGVFALMAGLVIDFSGDLKLFAALGLYAITVIVGLLILIFLFYPLLIRLFSNIPVKHFIKKMNPVQMIAFTTSSSSATLAFTMETAEKEMNISKETASFVLPIGATINMDGTSCFQAISVIFIAQVLGLDLTFSQILLIILMTTISSIGTPGIPGGSYVILTMVLTSVGIPAHGMALILGVDRPLDMLRTAVNVTGDVTVAAIVDKSTLRKSEKSLEEVCT